MTTKSFAQEARRNLLEAVSHKLQFWGFEADGSITAQPQQVAGGYTMHGKVYDDPAVLNLWSALSASVKKHGVDEVIEKAAYTWFNRIMALRILAKNGYERDELAYVEGMNLVPQLLQRARQGKTDYLSKAETERLQKVITDYSKDQEAFAILLIGYCHSHPTLKRVFGRIDDYTELLLPDNILQESGFLNILNTTDGITDDEYEKVELIGWLYQFYISEKKDEVFASFKKNKKAEAKDIPAATQIFTPNWIVKYMVENTAGKIWLDKNPQSKLKGQMKYLVENESDASATGDTSTKPIINSVEELTLIDPAVGSGHILVEGFELIYQMYMEEYYTPEEAVQSILKNNLFGLDIDDRAAQLANFAILLKVAKVYPAIWEKDWLPNVYAMPEAHDFGLQEIKDFLGADGLDYTDELESALRLMKQAKNLGAIMKLNLSEDAQAFIQTRFIEIENTEYRDIALEAIYNNLKSYIPILLLLTKKYTAVVANPPYMGQKSMNAGLKNYVNINYPLSKTDLMTVFVELTNELLFDKAYRGIITLDSWMLNKTFKNLRLMMLETAPFATLLHIGWNCFPEGHLYNRGVAWTSIRQDSINNGVFINLSNVPAIVDKHELFIDRNRLDNKNLYIKGNDAFLQLPDNVICYWLSSKVESIFNVQDPLSKYGEAKIGLQTGDNNKFRRDWSEVDFNKTAILDFKNPKWIPYNSGGDYRKWYGNQTYFVNWENKGSEIISLKPKSVVRNKQFYFKESVSWSKVTSSGISLRYFPEGFIFDVAGCSIFSDNGYIKYLMGLLNSVLNKSLVKSLSQTINYEAGQISNVPIVELIFDNVQIPLLVDCCIDLARNDWDSRENSWNFKRSPLLEGELSLEFSYQQWKEKVSKDFFQLHENEEELNRIFIDIYGLQEELTPEVALKDITILQDELYKKDLEDLQEAFDKGGAEAIELPIDEWEVIAQFVSYCIGILMGRYRLDKPCLNIAHPNPTDKELDTYTYNKGKVLIDEDAIVPLMGSNANFPDDAYNQINGILDTIWGAKTRTANVNFIQECLGKDLEKFLFKDFYKYHCSMYKKKPIYWLFSSKKGAFQVLVYMHRMNEFTVEKIRANYLIEHMKYLKTEINILDQQGVDITNQESNRLDQMRKDLNECEDYDLLLKDVADQQIKFDLDDGVSINYKLFETVLAKIK